MSDTDRIEAAFLAAGIDPEFSAVIHEYHKNVYVYALVHTLANYMERCQQLEGEASDKRHEIELAREIWGLGSPGNGRNNPGTPGSG